jgi:uncharacterized protein YbaP (TraB family)
MILKFFKRALALVGLATAAYATPQASVAPTAARPALWEVSDPDTTIYLFGTIHLLPENYDWKSPTLQGAIDKSNELYVETIVDPKNPAELIAALTKLGYSNGLPPIAERVPPEKRALLQAAIAKSGIPAAAFDRMETWAAAFTLLGVQYRSIGLAGDNGVEQTLRDSFGAEGKPIGQLETNSEQLAFFDRLPERAQRSLLEGAIEGSNTAGPEFAEMLRGWASGDVEAIARTFNHDLSGSPDLRKALLENRNENWSRWIEQRLGQPGTIMIAVGAGHLAGRDSVLTMLQHAGYRVQRIQ